jgi:hypothetical protein
MNQRFVGNSSEKIVVVGSMIKLSEPSMIKIQKIMQIQLTRMICGFL